jgi:thiamine-phosphate pyrophosphorylase
VEAALQEPVSYLAVGPVFPTGSKASAHEPVGLRGVAQTAARAAARGLPTVAIGGVTLAQAPAVIRAGADAVAVIADLLVGGDPTARVRAYLDALGA